MPRSIIPPDIFGGFASTRYPSINFETLELLDAPPDGQPFPQPSPAELDSLYASEARQFRYLAGLRLVEAGLLHDLEPLGPDPELEGEDLCDLKVDESSWIRPLQRQHWMRYARAIPGTSLEWDPGDDRFWNLLRPVLELANRFILHASTHKWLHSSTNAPGIEHLRGVSLFRESGEHEKGHVLRITEVDGTKTSTLDVIAALNALARNHLNSFEELDGSYGITCTFRGQTSGYQIMLLDCQDAQILFQTKKYSKVLRRQMAYQLARTVAHEMMHVLHHQMSFKAREHLKITPADWEVIKDTDMYYAAEQWAEAGTSFSNAVFKGETHQHTDRTDGGAMNLAMFSLDMPSLGAAMSSTPSYSTDEDPDFSWRESADNLKRCVPALWADAHLRESFWTWMATQPVESLWAPNLFLARFGESDDGWHRAWRMAFNKQGTLECQPELQPRLVKLAENAVLYRRRVNLLRKPWYRQTLATWQMTPYSDVSRRLRLELMLDTQKISSRENEYKMWCLIDWLGAEEPEARSRLVIPQFYKALANLGCATMPVRKSPIYLGPPAGHKDTSTGEHPFRYTPWIAQDLRDRFGKAVNFNAWWRNMKKNDDDAKERMIHRHLKGGSSKNSHNQQINLMASRIEIDWWALTAAVPLGLYAELTYAWRTARVALDMDPSNQTWHTVDFEMPPYPGVTSQAADWTVLLDSHEYEGSDIGSAEGDVTANLSMADVQPPAAPALRYYTVGRVGDHQHGLSDTWFGLRPIVGSPEIAVYDISSLLRLPNVTEDQLLSPKASHQLGRMMKDKMPEALVNKVRELVPIGLVMQHRSLADVHAKNGRDGKDRWMMIGAGVYDVTVCLNDFTISEDLQKSIERSVGINPVVHLMKLGRSVPRIKQELSRHCVGTVLEELDHPRRRDRIFTRPQLAWHTNTETGLYVSLGKDVYDVTDYVDLHPGGYNALATHAGGPIDVPWEKYHSTDELAKSRLEKLRIGRIVDEHYANDPIFKSHICLETLVYDVASLEHSPDEKHRAIWNAAKQWFGFESKLINLILRSGTPPQSLLDIHKLLTTPEMRWRIVSKLGHLVPELPLLGAEQLAQYAGQREAKKKEGKSRRRWADSWVAAGSFVFNVTSLLQYGTEEYLSVLEESRGHLIEDDNGGPASDAIYNLLTNQRHLIVARYTPDDVGDEEFLWREPWRDYRDPTIPFNEANPPQIPELSRTPLSGLTPAHVGSLAAPIEALLAEAHQQQVVMQSGDAMQVDHDMSALQRTSRPKRKRSQDFVQNSASKRRRRNE